MDMREKNTVEVGDFLEMPNHNCFILIEQILPDHKDYILKGKMYSLVHPDWPASNLYSEKAIFKKEVSIKSRELKSLKKKNYLKTFIKNV